MQHEELQAVCKTSLERKVLARLVERAQTAQRQADSPFKNLRMCNTMIEGVKCTLIHGHAGDHYNALHDIFTDNSVAWRAEGQTFNSWTPPYNVVQYDDPPIDHSVVRDAIRRLKESPPAGSMYGASMHVDPALPDKTFILVNSNTLADIERDMRVVQPGMWI